MTPKSRRITIRDIALAAGISPATVSLAINGKGNLPDSRRKEIRDLARKMGYVANPLARALRGGKTGVVGVVINFFQNPFFRLMFSGLEEAAEEAGLTFMFSQSLDDLSKEAKYVRQFAEHGVDGLLVLPCGLGSDHLVDAVERYNLPLVLISHALGDRFAAVVADNRRGGELIAEHFLSLGPRTNVHLAGSSAKLGMVHRLEGFCSVMREHDRNGFDPKSHVVTAKALTAAEGYRVSGEILERFKPPVSIFAVNDEVAMGVLHFCRDKGLSTPDDVAVAGFSDVDILENYGIPLTTVRNPAFHMGKQLLALLLELQGKPESRTCPPVVTMPVSLVIRESTVGKENAPTKKQSSRKKTRDT